MTQAVLGGGCFWCLEALFQRVPGVLEVEPGYAGGSVADPTYEQVCSGLTGHAEVVRVGFDPVRLSYDALLERFWKAHDPTTPNRQGADIGTQYRSVIFTTDSGQMESALRSRAAAQEAFDRPIVTEIRPLERFHPAEAYHRDYYLKNPNAAYCRLVIAPKLARWG